MDDSKIPMKRCSKCGVEKPLTSEFFKWRKDRQIFDMPCKECMKANARAYYQAHQEEIKQRARNYGTEHKEEISSRRKQWWHDHPEEAKARSKRNYWSRRDADLATSRAYREANQDKVNAQKRAYYEANAEEIKAKRRAEYAENPEPILERNRQHRAEHLEERRAYDREYSRLYTALHPELTRARKQAWKVKNPDQVKVHKWRRKARIKSLPDTYTAQEWQHCLDYFGNGCAVCGKEAKLVADHWIALADHRLDNPGTVAWNIIPLCPDCNSTKWSTVAEDWLKGRYSDYKSQRDFRANLCLF